MSLFKMSVLDQKIPAEEACPYCKGSGRWVSCHSMKGREYRPCYECYGTGKKSEAVKHQLRRSASTQEQANDGH